MAQIGVLTSGGRESYLQVLDVLELVPWNGEPFNTANPDGAMRTLAFGRYGMVTYLILEQQQRVDVIDVVWLGS